MGEILIMLVNQFVVSTEMAVLNCRANYFVWNPTVATGVTLILQPAIGVRGASDVGGAGNAGGRSSPSLEIYF